ncbi:DUF1254 domain-containing protein [Schnuerera sp. xch1]|uniref:DUF1254 domain-containing protein n=1 Tax=Schnuerera sp. xch1 TaxID=2874283 RepID=UPI001CBB825D|nr:DUF1254 domain-containing protein [Schnuerera sp. xch1]
MFFRELITPDFEDVVSPNVDTVYCTAWLDLTRYPVVLNVSDTNDRYYVMRIMDAYTNTFSSIGRRTTGTDAGKFAIVGSDWEGVLSSELKAIKSHVNTAWIIGCVLAKGEGDMDNALKILK